MACSVVVPPYAVSSSRQRRGLPLKVLEMLNLLQQKIKKI
jgi:hypothetical protein